MHKIRKTKIIFRILYVILCCIRIVRNIFALSIYEVSTTNSKLHDIQMNLVYTEMRNALFSLIHLPFVMYEYAYICIYRIEHSTMTDVHSAKRVLLALLWLAASILESVLVFSFCFCFDDETTWIKTICFVVWFIYVHYTEIKMAVDWEPSFSTFVLISYEEKLNHWYCYRLYFVLYSWNKWKHRCRWMH